MPACAPPICFARPACRSWSSRHRDGRAAVSSQLRAPFDDGLHAEAGAFRIAGAHRAVLRAVRRHRLPLVPFTTSGSAVTAIDKRPATTLDDQRAWTLDLKPSERGLTPSALFEPLCRTIALRPVRSLPVRVGALAVAGVQSRDVAGMAGVTRRVAGRRETVTVRGELDAGIGALCDPAVCTPCPHLDPALQDRRRHGPPAHGHGRVARRYRPVQRTGRARGASARRAFASTIARARRSVVPSPPASSLRFRSARCARSK